MQCEHVVLRSASTFQTDHSGADRRPRLAARLRLPGLGRFGGRFAVILSGELIQSLFHFVLNVVLVRELTAREYGLFAIVFMMGAVGITYIRALLAVPATLFLSRSLGRPAERGYDVAFGSGAVFIAGLMAAATAGVLAPLIGWGALAGGAFVGLYGYRSYLRIVLLARKAPRIAGLSDTVYATCGIGLSGLFLLAIPGDEAALLDRAFLALAIAHAVGIGVALAGLRQPVRLSFTPRMRRRYLAIWRTLAWSLAGVTSNTVQGQGLTLLFATMVGPAAYAPIAATLVLFAPLRIPTNALTNMVLPEITRKLADGRTAEAKRLVVRSTGVIGLGCLVYGAAMWTALPVIEHHLFKGRFLHEPMNWIGLSIWTSVTISLLYAIPRAFLEAAAAFRTLAAGASFSAVLGFAVMIPLLATMPPAFALLGMIASELSVGVWLARAYLAQARLPEEPVLAAVAEMARAEAPPARP